MLEEADHCESGSRPAGSFCMATQKIPCVTRKLFQLKLWWKRSWVTSARQVLRLTQKVRRENEPPESAQLNFGAIFHGKFSLWLPCWAHIWILQHINSVFLMRNRSHIQNSQRNHLPSLFLQFGTLSIKWISHIRWMDLSYSGVLFLHNSTLQLVRLTWNDHAHENAIF